MKILVKPPGSPRSTRELAQMAELADEVAAEAKRQEEEKAALAAEAKRQQGLMDEMKPLPLSGPAIIVSKTSDAPLAKSTDPIVPLSVETPLDAKPGE